MSWFTALLKPLTEAFNNWRERKHEIKMANHDLKVTKVEAEAMIIVSEAESRIRMNEQRQGHEQNWEMASIANSGWRDEYVTLLFTLPAIAIFFPYAQEYVESGFLRLESTPVWYQMVLLAIVGSALGVRIWDSFLKPLVVNRKVQ